MPVTLTKEIIDQHERELEQDYSRRKEGIQAMRELLARMEAAAPPPSSRGSGGPRRARAAAPGKRLTLPAAIMEICERNKNQQWTMRLMLEQLRSDGFPLKQAKPELAISNAMGTLTKKGKLVVVAKRPGRAGTLYGMPSETQ